ncbi:J domain-containing protein [Candidatus Nitrosotenuis uzonensis]|uniref:DnaJ domain protein n=1 Tax=Candidatus Nitrosotenuis uzonensis TaxID=1407055 RepID=V6ARP7_9ARCH|nr:J domain-containing protein [Candidatus Nitrosotenuis uzonensis]CDI05327.1 putative DnaJ domain protein [Candidatus Nitrosotenuis uzonensis]
MVESNYDILGVKLGASEKEIRDAFRKLVLDHHSDRGGDEEKIKKIIQAYEDLKQGKTYPDTDIEKLKKARVYAGDSEEERKKRNLVLSGDVAREMDLAQEWAGLLSRSDQAGTKLFGSKELGEMEFERKQTGDLYVKGKFWAGHFTYDGSIMMAGSVTNPYFAPTESTKTIITVTKGNFTLVDALKNNFVIEHGAKITADNGDIIVGNLSGIRELQQDPQGRVGLYITKEHFTELRAPKGKIVAGTARETVLLDGDTVVVNNLINNVKVRARIISIFGSTVNYNCELELRPGGYIEFHDEGSGFALSDDALIKLENGKWFKLRDLKTSGMVGHGRQISYEYLDGIGKKQEKQGGFRLGSLFKRK